MTKPSGTIWVANEALQPAKLRAVAEEILPAARRRAAQQQIRTWKGYAPTPLTELPALAARLGVATIWCKDESGRFGIGSFKALGGAYAVFEQLQADPATPAIACATEGNHGRAVAWAAQIFGARCIVYLHQGVSAAREKAIAAYGAEIRRVRGSYDDSVRVCATEAGKNGWTVVSDTSWPGYEDIPRSVMAGYTLITQEILDQMKGQPAPTHVFLQGGVGGLAAAIIADMSSALGLDETQYIIVEPVQAACLQESLRAGRPTKAHGNLETVMAGLACGEPSPIALKIVRAGTSAAITITDDTTRQAMHLLAKGTGTDQHIVSGASGAAGLAGLMAAAGDLKMASALGLDRQSRVLLISTEGATDRDAYAAIVGTP